MVIFLFIIFASWTETFESQSYFPPDDWLIVNHDALDACWFRIDQGHNSGYSAICEADSLYPGLGFANQDYLITPQVFVQADDTVMSFWCRTANAGACSLDIMVCTDTPPSIPDFSIERSMIITNTQWVQYTVPLNTYSGNALYIAFSVYGVPAGEQLFIDDILLPDKTTQPFICNGRLRTNGPPFQKFLQVWGDHYDRGFAHGYLLGEEAMANLVRFAIGTSSLHRVTPVQYEYLILPYFRSHFTIPQEYMEEAQGAIDGCNAKGVDLTHPELGREMTTEDLVCLSALPDFNVMGCSSVSGWGNSTIDDDTLQGGTVIARDLDYSAGNYTCIGNTSVIIACMPSDPDEQRSVLVTVAGFMGCLSGINEKGLGLCCDYGYIRDTSYIAPNSLVPFTLSCRNALEAIDPDNSGINDIYDITFSVHDSSSLTCWDVQLFSPYNGSHPVPAGILEINNVNDSLRLVSDNYITPAINSDWNLLVTNHERVLYSPPYCYRYSIIADSLNNDMHLSTERAIALMNATAGWGYYAGTIQQIVFRPNCVIDHPDWPCIGVSYAKRNQGAHVQPKLWYTWYELFEGIPGIEEHGEIPVYTERPASIIAGPLPRFQGSYRIYDVSGREVDNNNVAPGIYFMETGNSKIYKVIKVR